MPLHPKALAAASYRQTSLAVDRRSVLKKFAAFFVTVSAFLLFANLASAQQGDAMFGFGTIIAPGAAACNATTGCPEKGGLYPNIGADVIFHQRIGFGFDVNWKGGQGAYGGTGGPPFRPILLDFNAVFQPRITKTVGLDLFGGIGWQDTRLYSGTYTCTITCTNYTSTNHFLIDVGAGIRYYVWGHVFVRPEVRYYNIMNNGLTNSSIGFSNNSIVRAGASIGYTIGGPE